VIQAANPSHALALVLVDELARCGVTEAVVAPGSRSTALAMALHDDPRLRLHVEIDERSAGFLALGLARVTGRPAVVVTTSGSATANLHPAVVEADQGAVPLLVLTADRPPELRHTGANQAIDQLKLYGDAVRWFCEVGVPEDRPGAVAHWRSTACRAVAEAVGLRGPAGPVHANLAFREPTVPATDDGRTRAEGPFRQPLEGRADRRAWTTVDLPPRQVPDAELRAFAGRLAATERGLLVIGDTTARPGPVHALAAATGWPVVAEPTSGARCGPHVVAHAGPLLGVAGFRDAHRPDLVLRVGRPTVSRAVLGLLDDRVPQVVVTPDGSWHDPTRAATDLVVADPDLLLQALADQLPVAATSDWRRSWLDADADAATAVAEVLAGEPAVTEPGACRAALAAVPDGGALVVASSMPIRDLDAWAPAREGVRVLANRGASGIDGFVSTALGVALAHDGPTVALAGDLSFLHDRNGLLVRPDVEQLDLVLVVVDNDGGGIFHFLPQAGWPGSFERVFGTPHGLDLADVARTHGLEYVAPEPRDLAHEVGRRARAGGLHLVHVVTDRHGNRDLHARLQAAVADAVGGSAA
jgi:2-succinyl-5-enolpyruvyl-6-hydroxy-3-cyclohexene-1-carboxylate synthase